MEQFWRKLTVKQLFYARVLSKTEVNVDLSSFSGLRRLATFLFAITDHMQTPIVSYCGDGSCGNLRLWKPYLTVAST